MLGVILLPNPHHNLQGGALLRQRASRRSREVHLQPERRRGEPDLRGRRAAGQGRQADALGRVRGAQLRARHPRRRGMQW